MTALVHRVPDVKVCSVCHQEKPLTEYLHINPTALRRQCKPCWRVMQRERCHRIYQANPTAASAQTKRWLDTGDNRARIQVAWRASAKLNAAIKKGLIVRPASCEQCGKACKPDGAHYDYSQPLNVRWLCRSCHVLWDHSNPKTKPAHSRIEAGKQAPPADWYPRAAAILGVDVAVITPEATEVAA